MTKPAPRNTNPMKMERFPLPARVAHWFHGISFLLLLLTGLGLVFKGIMGTSTLRTFGEVHRLIAWPFTFVALFILAFNARRTVADWISHIVRFDADDRKFLTMFPKEFFGAKVKMPPQGKFNAGEKINSMVHLTGWVVMVATGWIMVYKNQFSPEMFRWALVLHSTAALVLGAAALGHIYLAVGHPSSRAALSGMLTGLVSRKWALGHHRKWAESQGDD